VSVTTQELPLEALAVDPTSDAPDKRPLLPHGLVSARFGVLIGALLVGGLIAMLAVNTALAAGAIQLSGIQSTMARQTERQQALAIEVEGMSAPATLQRSAVGLGMVPAAAPAFLDPATGTISGALVPAKAGSAPSTDSPQVTLPDPEPIPVAPEGEPEAHLVMPPDRGSDGASVTVTAPAAATATDPTGLDQQPTRAPDQSSDNAALVGAR